MRGREGIPEFAAAGRALAGRARFAWLGPDDLDKADAIRISGVLDGVELLGLRRDVPAVLSAFDVFVVPSSHREGFSRSAMEAAACGRPMVLTDIRGSGRSAVPASMRCSSLPARRSPSKRQSAGCSTTPSSVPVSAPMPLSEHCWPSISSTSLSGHCLRIARSLSARASLLMPRCGSRGTTPEKLPERCAGGEPAAPARRQPVVGHLAHDPLGGVKRDATAGDESRSGGQVQHRIGPGQGVVEGTRVQDGPFDHSGGAPVEVGATPCREVVEDGDVRAVIGQAASQIGPMKPAPPVAATCIDGTVALPAWAPILYIVGADLAILDA